MDRSTVETRKGEPFHTNPIHPDGRSLIICDIDGVLSDDRRRRRYIPQVVNPQPEDWDRYHQNMSLDYMVIPITEFLEKSSFLGSEIHFITGRPQKYYPDTQKFIYRMNIGDGGYFIHMRPGSSNLSTPLLKGEKLIQVLSMTETEFNRIIMLDDNTENLKAYMTVLKNYDSVVREYWDVQVVGQRNDPGVSFTAIEPIYEKEN